MKRFPSIKNNEDFRRIYRSGKSYADGMLVMYAVTNETGSNRIGISASRKIGNSVVRHTMTRLVREAFRLNDEKVKKGYDLVVVVREGAVGRRYNDISRSYMQLIKKHNILI